MAKAAAALPFSIANFKKIRGNQESQNKTRAIWLTTTSGNLQLLLTYNYFWKLYNRCIQGAKKQLL